MTAGTAPLHRGGGCARLAPGSESLTRPPTAAAGEEAQLTQEKIESLRMRYLIVGQSSSDILHRLEQTLEASSRVGPAQEDVALWLGRMEKELAAGDAQLGAGPQPVSTSDQEKVPRALRRSPH